ncbi:unnamed protein product [Lactuca virosa]|uniref:Uncharacterized protein n=1 Tax=Lactuca virosa TaxID=75947 RepID=A0AAU9LZH6_9ASTR|nr:unnamed protein product [Lactuca virosa]
MNSMCKRYTLRRFCGTVFLEFFIIQKSEVKRSLHIVTADVVVRDRINATLEVEERKIEEMLYPKILAKNEVVQRKTLKIFNNGNTIRHSSTLLELSTRRFRMKSEMYQMSLLELKLDVLKNIKACQGTKMASISHRGISDSSIAYVFCCKCCIWRYAFKF